MIAKRPVAKADIPAAIPTSIVSAKAGLIAISSKIVPPAGIDLYNEFVNDVPMKNKIGIATMSPIDHLPNIVFGEMLQGCFVIISSFLVKSFAFILYCALSQYVLSRFPKKDLFFICYPVSSAASIGQPFLRLTLSDGDYE